MLKFDIGSLKKKELLELYKSILLPRRIEEKMLLLLRQGKVSKWFAGIGQEAISVGITKALYPDEWIMPLHRNLGVFTSRDIDLQKLFAQFQGKENGFTKGRDRSFHFGVPELHISGMISHLGPQMTIANGTALAHLLKKEEKLSVAFCGDGGTSEGDFHEALNVASVWQLPCIFIIENNGYGLSTPINEQYNCKDLKDRAIAYGMRGIQIDGNNILEVYHTIKKLGEELRKKPEPVLLECLTFRMRGHEEASGTKYVPKELMEEWAKKDPVENYEAFLIKEAFLSKKKADQVREEIDQDIKKAWELAEKEVFPLADTQTELKDIYREYSFKKVNPEPESNNIRFVDAISGGLNEAMDKFDNMIIMGQDVAEYGGVFKITQGFVVKYGKDRIRNTPLCESAILGAAVGLSMEGYKSVVEMQFADFVSSGFNQVVNNMAKLHYRWGQNVDCVIRMPTGAGVGAGPFHSQSNEAWFFHTPGLKIVYPSTPQDAKGLLIAAVEDPNPVLFFEHKFLYRSLSAEVNSGYYNTEIGKARKVQEGNEISIICYGLAVVWAEEISREFNDNSIEIIDLRSLSPLDYYAIDESVKKTGKVLILHEDTLLGGIGSEISAYVSEHLFEYLDAPVKRVTALDTPVPFSKNLEDNFLPKERLKTVLAELINY